MWIVDDLSAPDDQASAARKETDFNQWLLPDSVRYLAKTLITTRVTHYRHQGVTLIPLDALDKASAYKLLTRDVTPSNDTEKQAACGIMDDLGCHALALDVAGRYIAEHAKSLAVYATFRARLDEPDDVLDEEAAEFEGELPNFHEKKIAKTIKLSIDELILKKPKALDVLLLADQLAALPIPNELFAQVLGRCDDLQEATAQGHCSVALQNAASYSLIERNDKALTFSVHALIRRTTRFHYRDAQIQARREALRRAAVAVLAERLAHEIAKFHRVDVNVLDEIEQNLQKESFLLIAQHAIVLMKSFSSSDIPPLDLRFTKRMQRFFKRMQWSFGMYLIRRRPGPIHDSAEDNLRSFWQWGYLADSIGYYNESFGSSNARLKAYQVALQVSQALVEHDPNNLQWQRDLSVSYERIGDVQAGRNVNAALDAYQASLAIAQRLADHDPNNLEWQRHLSVSYDKIGDVQAGRNVNAALEAYQASLAIAQRLADHDPNNLQWQRDLSVSYQRIGDVQAGREVEAALQAYHASLAIRQRLAAHDPNNLGWKCDLAFIYGKMGEVCFAQENMLDAANHYRRAVAILEPLVTRTTPPYWKQALVYIYDRLADTLEALGQPEEAQIYRQKADRLRNEPPP